MTSCCCPPPPYEMGAVCVTVEDGNGCNDIDCMDGSDCMDCIDCIDGSCCCEWWNSRGCCIGIS